MFRAACVAATMLMLLVAGVLKVPSIHGGAPNLEATYHVLLTDTALAASPASQHHYLPTVTLGHPEDKFIKWGATVPLPSGHQVYTSFAAPGFIVPYVYFQVIGEAPSREALFRFSLLLQLLVVAALFTLLVRLLLALEVPSHLTWASAVAGTSLQIFSAEALLAYGAIYWSQQLYQLVFVLLLICVLVILRRDGVRCVVWVAALALLAFIGPWIEWTGLVCNGGVVLLFAYRGIAKRQFWGFAALVGAASLLGILAVVGHMAMFAGVDPVLEALLHRAQGRSGRVGEIPRLVLGYWKSFALLPVFALAAIPVIWRLPKTQSASTWAVGLPMLFVASFVLVENLLLAQHATEFSFDRMKAVVPMAMVTAFMVAKLDGRARDFAVAVLALLLVHNIAIYQGRLDQYRAWHGIDRENQRFAAAVKANANITCASLATADKVRAYSNLLFQRDISENVTLDQFRMSLGSAQARRCGAVYLVGHLAFTDLEQFERALIWSDGTWRIIALTSQGQMATSGA